LVVLNSAKPDIFVYTLDVVDSTRISRIPDKTVRLLSNANYVEQNYTITHIELRLYQKKNKLGIYSIITFFVETNKGTIEHILREGYLGPNALEDEVAYLTSHPVLSEIILNAIRRLGERLRSPYNVVAELKNRNLIALIKANGFLKNLVVEEAIRNTPRHIFVPDEFVEEAYEDKPLPTKSLQTTSQPSVVAKMTELLDVKADSKILEIGSGSGWQSAILSKLATNGKIYSIEIIPEIAEFAKQNHKKAGIKNVEIIQQDGTLGLIEEAPFDRIIVTAACKEIPPPLIEQLKTDGLLLAPVGSSYLQDMVLLTRTLDSVKELKREPGFVFVPLVGKYGMRRIGYHSW
jgi:protein-L-isoaspartate(D-aspartate) O-methyltransferase